MKRTLDVRQAMVLFYQLEDGRNTSSSESDLESEGDDMDDPSFAIDNER